MPAREALSRANLYRDASRPAARLSTINGFSAVGKSPIIIAMDSDAQLPAAMSPVTCARCGAGFNCSPGHDCWCAAEPFRLPMPEAGSSAGCLCPTCLRAFALGHQALSGEA